MGVRALGILREKKCINLKSFHVKVGLFLGVYVVVIYGSLPPTWVKFFPITNVMCYVREKAVKM